LLREYQEGVSEADEEITEETQPRVDLAEFDSHADVMATGSFLVAFGLGHRYDIQCLFKDEDANGKPFARSVGQAADHIVALMSEEMPE